ncbi:MAG: hypothetical protein U1E62_05475 [Alsobacter sp.]
MPLEYPTEVSWDGPGVQPYSARGLSHTYEMIPAAGVVRRTINGTLRDRSVEQFRLFKTTIAGTDVMAPAFEGIYPGVILTVECGFWLSYPTGGGSPSRPVVDSYTYEAFTFYRPRLSMMVMPGSPSNTFDVNGARNGWKLELEEVEAPA